MDISAYHTEYDFSDFPMGAKVVDIGCGEGRFLHQLTEAGCHAVGFDPDPEAVAKCLRAGFDVHVGYAEALPLADSSMDGVVCSVVLPYTNEKEAIREWSRILIPGRKVILSCHGSGYALRYLFAGPNVRVKFYGLRMIINTWIYSITGKRLPSWLGDTIYQSTNRLARYFKLNDLQVQQFQQGRKYFGFPVYIYYDLVKSDN